MSTRASRAARLAATALLTGTALLALRGPTDAQSLGDVFRQVSRSVVVIRAKGSDVEASGRLTRFNETGSGVLISADGKIMTAAHVLHSMDKEISA